MVYTVYKKNKLWYAAYWGKKHFWSKNKNKLLTRITKAKNQAKIIDANNAGVYYN